MTSADKIGSDFLRALVARMRSLGLNQSALGGYFRFCHALGMDFIAGMREENDIVLAIGTMR